MTLFTQSLAADAPRVATDIPPIHALVSDVMEGIATPDLVIRPGASPHGYAMRPSEAATLEKADVVIWVGDALTPWLHDTIATLNPDAPSVQLMDLPDTQNLPFREGVSFEHHDEEEGHDHHETADPHVWLDPKNAIVWLQTIAETLAAHDPENAARYQENAQRAQVEIIATQAQINAILEGKRTTPFIVFHDAYQHFETRFGLAAAGAISLADATPPSPARISEIQHVLQDLNVRCVFSEPQYNSGLVTTVISNSGARVAQLDPLGVDLPQGVGMYPNLLLQMAKTIATCLK